MVSRKTVCFLFNLPSNSKWIFHSLSICNSVAFHVGMSFWNFFLSSWNEDALYKYRCAATENTNTLSNTRTHAHINFAWKMDKKEIWSIFGILFLRKRRKKNRRKYILTVYEINETYPHVCLCVYVCAQCNMYTYVKEIT